MNPHHRHKAHPRSPSLLLGWSAVGVVALLLLILGISWLLQREPREKLVIPDEKAAAARLLAEQLTGPRYFQVPPGDMRNAAGIVVPTTPEPHLTTMAARSQVERIIKERNFSADQAEKVEALIKRLTETPDSRVVGEEHINLLRLNLALDALK